MLFKKKDKESKPKKEKKVPVMKVGTHKKTVIALWLVLIASVSFGVYKNFTAIDMHTVHEKEVIEQRIVDTNKIENFVKAFAKSYYSWSNTQESIEKRTAAINQYLTKSLQDLNVDTVRMDIPTSSTVTDVKIWEVEAAGMNDFTVVYSVDQTVTEGETTIGYTSAYIDMHTVHEKEVIEQRIVDTNKIENFVKAFAKSYYSWSNTQESIEKRTAAINQYLTKSLQDLNVDTVRMDIPTSSTVTDVKIWEVEAAGMNDFTVVYSVDQTVTEGETTIGYTSAYMVVVHVDGDGNLVITQNPTISSIPTKSGYEPKTKESDGTVDAATTEEVTEFLETFFKLYPTATEKELAYYVSGNVLEPVNCEYVFSELVNPIFTQDGEQVKVSVSVKYLDQRTKATQISQFDLTLEKDSNWKIVK